jgi:hypothetical protein
LDLSLYYYWRLGNFDQIINFFVQNGWFCSWFNIFCIIFPTKTNYISNVKVDICSLWLSS